MKNKNWLIAFLLIVIIVLGSYIIYTKIYNKRLITNNIITITTDTTDTTKLALCSNEYYDTEYDEEGKIVIKNFGESEKIECSETELEPSPASGINACWIKRHNIKYILDLICLQKLDYTSSNICDFFDNQDIPLLVNFKNLEYFESFGNPCKNLFETLSNLPKLKTIVTDCSIKNTTFLSKLINLEVLDVSLWEGEVQEINFNDIPLSIKKLSFYDYDNGNYKITNIGQISNLIHLEKFSWQSPCFIRLNNMECPENLKNLFLQVIKLGPSIKEINSIPIDQIDKDNFQWDNFMYQLEHRS